MWFKMLSLLIGVPCMLKGILGLLLPDRFYRWRQAQYVSERPPAPLFLAPLALAVAVAVTWYATLVHYSPWGWVVTSFVTAAAVLGLADLVSWRHHRGRALRSIRSSATRKAWIWC